MSATIDRVVSDVEVVDDGRHAKPTEATREPDHRLRARARDLAERLERDRLRTASRGFDD